VFMFMWLIRFYGALLLGLVFITPGAAASNSFPLQVEDALRIKSFANCSPIALSPDGSWVAYTVKDFSKQLIEGDKRYEDFTRTGITSQAVLPIQRPGNQRLCRKATALAAVRYGRRIVSR